MMSEPPRGVRTDGIGFIDRYFRTAPAPDRTSLDGSLWIVSEQAWGDLDEAYRHALIEQYKTYVEMADRNTARRGQTNTFFLTLNTLIFTGLGAARKAPAHGSIAFLTMAWVVLVGQCLVWFWLLRSYRQLNTAKFAVINAMEGRLPAAPWTGAEWTALGGGVTRLVTGRSAGSNISSPASSP
jgi:hypothetical protein